MYAIYILQNYYSHHFHILHYNRSHAQLLCYHQDRVPSLWLYPIPYQVHSFVAIVVYIDDNAVPVVALQVQLAVNNIKQYCYII